MKKTLLLLVAALLPLLVSADPVEINGIWYNLIPKAKQAEVTQNPNGYTGHVEIPSTVNYDGKTYDVTSIGEYAFIIFYDGEERYSSSISSVTIPNSVTSIGEYAFLQCENLVSVTIPESVVKIGNSAFLDCFSLTSVHISSIDDWRNISFSNSASNPLYHAKNLYLNGKLVTELTIPDGVTSIGDYVFYNCSNLTDITLPNSVTNIGGYAFYGCSSLTSINIPENVTSIGHGAFYDCSSLTSINIPEGVTGIGVYAFRNCSSLATINIPESSQLTMISDEAFYNCTNLTSIIIPDGVTYIGWGAFYNCSNLASVMMPKRVYVIGDYAFYGCSSLTSITIPKIAFSEDRIGEQAFANCTELTDVYCYADVVPYNTSISAFEGSYPEHMTLHVPVILLNEYKATAPWSSFGKYETIAGEEFLGKCSTPTISYVDGRVVLTCATEGATIKSNTLVNGAGDRTESEFELIPTYTITVYATKTQYEDSDVISATLCWIPCAGNHEGEGIINIPSKPVLIKEQGGTLVLSGLVDGTEVAVYDMMGTEFATAVVANGTATLATSLGTGSTAIVKIGTQSVKVLIK